MGERVEFRPESAYRPAASSYTLLPFRFARIPGVPGRVLVTSEVGEWHFLGGTEFRAFVGGALDPTSDTYADLHAKHFLVEGDPTTAIRLLAAKYRTRKSFLRDGPGLHVFVTTLRCDHSCTYCQVSRRPISESGFDMSERTALAAIDRLFESPSPTLTVEFQGGEPLVGFDRLRHVTEAIVARNRTEGRNITFSMTSTLHLATDEMLAFFRQHGFQLSTSLDGPAWLHDANRPMPTRDSHRRTVAAIERARAVLGHDKVTALTTLTRRSLDHPEAIVDEYVRLGFRSVFLRPLSPFGFAARAARRIGYSAEEFLRFYERALGHILDLNRQGVGIDEAYAGILLTHVLTPFPTGYADLRSPTGAGLGAVVYNYDGAVYASDESRMLAEAGDPTFRLGTVHDRWADLMRSPAMDLLLATGIAEVLPGCSDCAFLPYCGADPVFNLAREGEPVGHRPTNDHCRKHTGLFHLLFRRLAEADPHVLRTFLSWVTRGASDAAHAREAA
ncbi:His-Xaa-Ser system radical SAM maturase HxsB [Azospirillum canadense]|uniref:His-Xaa-Ser system radical SAM maturase HxsB n=1 Tax=Azospirillum canadense TaxID=403962 RepID=UPI002225D561|nr:His-Xaa-Ser system radical SAM maturase HxsB [Azospirillum canadense]MCW2243164.1 His-Xaa-Ser system radical SAM maturase HxsB [Azospirillum canadense]